MLEVGRVDWRAPEALVARAPFDLVIAADVLYEARNVSPLLALVVTLESEVLLADPGRRHAADFLSAAAEHFRIGRACEGVHRLVPRRRAAASPRG